MSGAVNAITDVFDFVDDVVGSVVNPVLSVLGSDITNILVKIADVLEPITAVLNSDIGRVVKFVLIAVAPFTAALNALGSAIGGFVGGIAPGITGALGGLVQAAGGVISGFTESILTPLGDIVTNFATTVETMAANFSGNLSQAIGQITTSITGPLEPVLGPIKETLESIKGTIEAIRGPVDVILEPIEEVREVVSDIADLKVMYDLITGTGKVTDNLGAIVDGKGAETAVAIAELVKSIATLGIGMVDKVNTEIELTRATAEAFKNKLTHSIDEKVDLAKATVLGMITPKMTTLGEYSLLLNRSIARLARHVEDEAWFATMLLKVLR